MTGPVGSPSGDRHVRKPRADQSWLRPLGGQRAGAGACTTTFSKARQAYLGLANNKYPEPRRHDIEPLTHILGDPMQRIAAARTGVVVDIDHHLDPLSNARHTQATVPVFPDDGGQRPDGDGFGSN